MTELTANGTALSRFRAVDPATAAWKKFGLTNPGGASEDYALSTVGGRLRVTANASLSNANLREVRIPTSTPVVADSEIISTWHRASAPFSDATGVTQPGHAHRVTAHKNIFEYRAATAGGATTITDSTRSWTTNIFSGVGQREFFVTIVDGAGVGQSKRIISNTATALTVESAWTTNPDNTSVYEVWTWATRAIVLAKNVVLNAHALMNVYTWEGAGYVPVSGTDLGAYLKPSSIYRQFPWRVKSRLVANTLDFIVTVGTDADVPYGTAGRGASVTIPAGFDSPGQSGLYIGHLSASMTMDFGDIQINAL